MIVFNLVCSDCEYPFEGWFDNTQLLKIKKDVNLLIVQIVKVVNIKKALVAPNVAKKSNAKILKNKKTLASNIKKIKK